MFFLKLSLIKSRAQGKQKDMDKPISDRKKGCIFTPNKQNITEPVRLIKSNFRLLDLVSKKTNTILPKVRKAKNKAR